MSQISPVLTDIEIEEELGRRLRALRRARKLEIQAAAKATGLSRRTVYRAELGDNPTLITLLRLLRLYGRLGDLDAVLRPAEVSPMAILDASTTRATKASRRNQAGKKP